MTDGATSFSTHPIMAPSSMTGKQSEYAWPELPSAAFTPGEKNKHTFLLLKWF